MNVLHHLSSAFESGNSWIFPVLLMVITVLMLIYFYYKKNIFSDWAYETLLPVPKSLQMSPVLKKWFELTRGVHYDIRDHKQPMSYYLKIPNRPKTRSDCLMSGFAFLHVMLHFCLTFFCPRIAPWTFICSIVWEIIESVVHAHCTIDIVWNTLGCVMGLVARQHLFPC